MDEMKDKEAVLARARQLCATREYCVSDIRSKMASWGTDEHEAEKMIAILKKEKFIDEARYAGAFARDRFRYQKCGKVKIAAAMKLKHIPSDIIAEGMATIDESEYRDALREILAVHRKNIKSKNQYDLRGKLMRHALAKGYESHLVYEMIGDIISE